jgi:hypothetical protein
MKKLFIVLMIVLGFTSCKCSSDTQNDVNPELIVENLISMDKEDMFVNYGENYKWFETCVVYDNYLDADTTITVNGVSNVFQVLVNVGDGYDTYVLSYAHTINDSSVDTKHGFWVEDNPLNDEDIKITFTQALEYLFAANLPKPHSKYVVLRKEVGPLDANAQYIFGNNHYQVYVDAVTGEVRDYNPVFPKDNQLNYAFSW